MRPTETDKAWIAGFIDGEGCITITAWVGRPGQYQARIEVCNTAKDSLSFIVQFYGGTIRLRIQKNKEKAKPIYQWLCPIGTMGMLLTDILPYLRVKNTQAVLILDFLDLSISNKGPGKRIDSVLLKARYELYNKLKILNKRGP